MRARLVYEKFTEESDPIRDMGIGIIETSTNLGVLKQKSIEELQELYNRVHNLGNAQVMVDGQMFGSLNRYTQIRFNNMIVKALKYKRSIGKRDEVRAKRFKEGDAIKCQIKGEWFRGYPQFSKRGIIQTDAHGRIVAKTLSGNMKVPIDFAIPLTPKEQREFDKESLL